jgi:riboflavin kinase/FMN adenylyltransferase
MQIHISLPDHSVLERSALTVGTFDGVHCGHQFLISELKRMAAQQSLPTAVLTFQDMPYCFFRPDECPHLLTLPQEKIEAFRQLEIDHLFIVPFGRDIAEQSYDRFTHEVLCEKLGMKLLLAGPDFALGKDRAGDLQALSALGETLGYSVEVLEDKLLEAGAPISSTRVRGCVENGEVESAARMLGHPFCFEGEVVSGKQLGRTIGMPTINLKTHPRKVLPGNGVYAARAIFPDATEHAAALSVGTNPTTDTADDIKIEFHVLDETISVPPPRAKLQIIARLRDEAKFDSVETLVAQMQLDLAAARKVLL